MIAQAVKMFHQASKQLTAFHQKVERRAEEPLDTNRTWEPPDEQELAQYAQAPQPNAMKTSEKESRTTHQFHEHAEPSDNGSVPQPEEEITGEATALHQVTVAIQPPVQATASPAPSAFAQPALPVEPIRDEPQQPPARMPQASQPVADTTTPVDLLCLRRCRVHSLHLLRSPKQRQSLRSTTHSPRSITWTRTSRHIGYSLPTMRWTLQPQPLPASLCLQAIRPTRPPGCDVWWVAEPITNPDSPRHQPKPAGSGWVSFDGSWWRNYWHSHGNSVPEEATRACPDEYTYSHDPAWWYNSRIWVHPYRPEHEAFMKGKQSKPSAAFKAPPTHPTPSVSFPPANTSFSPTTEFKWGEPLESPAPGFDKSGQTKPSSLYNVRNEQKALAQLHQGYAI